MKTKILYPLLLFSATAWCQSEPSKNAVQVVPSQTIRAKAGSTVTIPVGLRVEDGYHVNSNKPAEDFLIPLKLTWNPGPLTGGPVSFPQPQLEKLQFSEKPLSVFKGSFEIATRFKVPSGAQPGSVQLTGKLRYQACNDRMCLTPKTVDVAVPVEIFR